MARAMEIQGPLEGAAFFGMTMVDWLQQGNLSQANGFLQRKMIKTTGKIVCDLHEVVYFFYCLSHCCLRKLFFKIASKLSVKMAAIYGHIYTYICKGLFMVIWGIYKYIYNNNNSDHITWLCAVQIDFLYPQHSFEFSTIFAVTDQFPCCYGR